MYWGWIVQFGLKAKDRDLSMGLDKDGRRLKRITAATRKHRKSAMTPTGKGDPSAPPLVPGRQKSRVRSLLTGRAEDDRAEFWWKFDPVTGQSFARVLEEQQEQGRDVFGLSPVALRRVVARAWEQYAKWEKGKSVEMPKAIGIPIYKEQLPYRPSPSVGGFRAEDWEKFFRKSFKVEVPGREPETRYNIILGHIWGKGIAPPKPPKPKPKPKPEPEPVPEPMPAYTLDVLPGLSPEAEAEFRATIEALPAPVLDLFGRDGTRFVVGEKMADYDADLAKEKPRGWPEGTTWANAEGLHEWAKKEVVALRTMVHPSSGETVVSGRRQGVLRHEAGHGFDRVLGHASLHPDFVAAYNKDVAAIDPREGGLVYYLQAGSAGREEVFAEVFAQVHGGGAMSWRDVTGIFGECARLIREWAAKGAI